MKTPFERMFPIHGRRLREGRPGERVPPAAHTLTEALLPTTCVVVNKPPALKHFLTTGACAPPVRKSFMRTAKTPQEVPAPRAASHACHTAASGEFGEDGVLVHDNRPIPRDQGLEHAADSFLPAFPLWAYGTRQQQGRGVGAT